MKKLQVPEPTLKQVKDFCFMGIVKAGQKLSFTMDEELKNDEATDSLTMDSLIDFHAQLQAQDESNKIQMLATSAEIVSIAPYN